MTDQHNEYDERRLADNPDIQPYFFDIPAETAASAYHGTSHFPERAGSIIRSDYAASLVGDKDDVLKTVEGAIRRGATVDENYKEVIDGWFVGHRRGLKSAYMSYLNSHSRVASAFIVGPARFPVQQMEKRNRSVDNRLGDINHFRESSKKAVLRQLLPYGDGYAIRTDDPDAGNKVSQKIQKLERQREQMKAANKVVRKFYKRTDTPVPGDGKYGECIAALVAMGFSHGTAELCVKPDPFGDCQPFPSYKLTNLGAEIRRLKQRTQNLEKVQDTAIDDAFDNGITATISDDGKIVIHFGFKPDEDTRAVLKRHSFKWSRGRESWVRKLTSNAAADYGYHIMPMLVKLASQG